MSTLPENFFHRLLTKEEWDDPDFMKFSNAEIPASDVELGTILNEAINE